MNDVSTKPFGPWFSSIPARTKESEQAFWDVLLPNRKINTLVELVAPGRNKGFVVSGQSGIVEPAAVGLR